MRRIGLMLAAATLLVHPLAAQSKLEPASVNLRLSEEISNAPPGSCSCFAMEGFAVDVAWHLLQFGPGKAIVLSGVADMSVEHTGSIDGAPYGLTLTAVAFGPRLTKAVPHHAHVFAQTLFGVTHGSNSQFPQSNNTLVSSATSFGLDLGAGFEHSLTKNIDLRLLQAEYLRTALPNNSTGWQNNLRLGSGITFHWQ